MGTAEDPIYDDNERLGTVVDTLGGGSFVAGLLLPSSSDPTGAPLAATGVRGKINGDRTSLKYVLVYDDEGDYSDDELTRFVEREATHDIGDVSVEENDATGVVTATTDTESL